MENHIISKEHVHTHWSRNIPPVLYVRTGETIKFETVASDNGQVDPDRPKAEMDNSKVHPITGPVYVQDALPGDALEIQILSVHIGEWGWQMVRPGRGYLPNFVERSEIIIVEIDRQRQVAVYPSGAEVPLDPFPGIVGVAPAQDGHVRTFTPGPHAGNIDVRDLRPGSALFVPVWVPGGLLSIGDVHAAMGDGEVCLTGIETYGSVLVRVILHKGLALDRPHIKTETHYGILGTGATTDDALQDALLSSITFLRQQTNLSPNEAYAICSGGCDMRINQLVNIGAAGARVMFPLHLLHSLGIAV